MQHKMTELSPTARLRGDRRVPKARRCGSQCRCVRVRPAGETNPTITGPCIATDATTATTATDATDALVRSTVRAQVGGDTYFYSEAPAELKAAAAAWAELAAAHSVPLPAVAIAFGLWPGAVSNGKLRCCAMPPRTAGFGLHTLAPHVGPPPVALSLGGMPSDSAAGALQWCAACGRPRRSATLCSGPRLQSPLCCGTRPRRRVW